jgi:hypothetical protein
LPEPEVTLALQFRPYNTAARSQHDGAARDQMTLSGPIGGVALGEKESVRCLLRFSRRTTQTQQRSRHAPLFNFFLLEVIPSLT